MTTQNLPLVLCVDDEVRVVESLALSLRRDFEVHTALSGQDGLAKLKAQRGFAVVVSDMRMPGMDGAVFLKHVMRQYPQISRILLTGDPGRDAVVLAVNEGQIFRYLTKPCAPELLHSAIDAGVMQYRLVQAERSVLQETLIGCVQALIDVLAITNPVAFGRASRVKRLSMQLADELSCTGFWQLEGAAMLSQIGYLSLPVELVEKLYYGDRLTPEEKTLAEGVPQVAHNLLAHIPRLEPVLQILSAVSADDEALSSMGDGSVATGARMLSLVLDYDSLVTQGITTDVAVQTLRGKAARYPASLVETFATLIGAASAAREMREMPLRMVASGMTIVDDLRTHLGTLLVPRGFDITETFLQRLHNLGAGILSEKVRVLVPTQSARAKAR